MTAAAMINELEDAPDVFPLATDEQQTLARCEAVIGAGLQTYIQVGRALVEIRDQRLYRATHQTYADYCNQRWGMSRQRAYQLIDASEVAASLSTIVDTSAMPESHLRAVAKAAPADRPEVLNRAVQIAGDSPLTAKHITQAAAEIARPAPDLADILLRLDAHGYAKTTTREKGSTTLYSFRDYSGRHDETGGEVELAEGELPYWLAELDSSAAYAQAKQERYLDAQGRAERLGYDLKRDGAQFLLTPAGQRVPALRGTLDAQIKTIEGYEKNATKRAAVDPLPSEDEQHRVTIEAILKGPHTPALIQQAYDHAAEIHDLALHNKMIALIDRATDTPPPPPPPTGPTLDQLDSTLPKNLSDAGYYWQSASPPIIANNDGWRGDAPTPDQALEAARLRMDSKGEPVTVFPALSPMECKALIREAKLFVEKGADRFFPTLGKAIRIAARMALEVTE